MNFKEICDFSLWIMAKDQRPPEEDVNYAALVADLQIPMSMADARRIRCFRPTMNIEDSPGHR